jgi:GNAT superfamily N-acetyltransferase
MPSTTESTAAIRWPTAVPLRDRSTVLVRPIEPSDRDLLRRGLERLSEESRYRRFLSPVPRLTASQLRYLTDVDHHDHEALIALEPASGEAVGVARYVRTAPAAAEFATTVVDDWQGRGLGSALMDLLAGRAREEGITHFGALLLAENEEMLQLLRRLGPVRVLAHEQGTVAVEGELPAGGAGERLRSILRLAAAGRVQPAGSLGRDQRRDPEVDRDRDEVLHDRRERP